MSVKKQKKLYKVTIRASVIAWDEESYIKSADTRAEAIKQALSEFEESRIIDESDTVEIEVENG